MKPGTEWKIMPDPKDNTFKFFRNGQQVFPTEEQLAEALKYSASKPHERWVMEGQGEAARQLMIWHLDELMFPEEQ